MCKELELLNSYEKLNAAIFEWANVYLKEDSKVAHVAISRKAPRLLEWCKQHGVGSNVDIITELALPFENWSQYDKYLLTDEAIYHGTTFEKILTLLVEAAHSWSSVYALPMVVTNEALESQSIRGHLVAGYSLLSKADIPFFVDTIISKFFELGKPYDIEYPLFYINFNEDITDGTMELVLDTFRKVLQEDYWVVDSPYSTGSLVREQNLWVKNYTFRTDAIFIRDILGVAMPDFSKLRFFKQGKRLCVASMTPYRIPEKLIRKDTPMFRGAIADIWNHIFEQAEQNRYLLEKKSGKVSCEYVYQWEKSLAMVANYLLSYIHFKAIKQQLLESIGSFVSSDFYLLREDLQYLLGTKLGDDVKNKLEHLLQSNSSFERFLAFSTSVDSVIPTNFQVEYNYQMAIDNQRLVEKDNVDMMLSSMFSAMHWKVEMASRKMKSEFSRLRFGETYPSMLDRFSKMSTINETILLNRINQGIDKRIDHGSVVPNYIKTDEGSFSGWVRMFRSGENEDENREQLFRILLNLVSINMEETQKAGISYRALEFYLAHIYIIGQYGSTLPRKVFAPEICPIFNEDDARYEIAVKLADKNMPLVQYAIDCDVLNKNTLGEISIADNDLARELAMGSVLDNDLVKELKRIAHYSEINMEKCRQMYIDTRECLNYMFFADPNLPMMAKIKFQQQELIHLIESNEVQGELVKRMALKCDALYWRFPDPGLAFNKNVEGYEDLESVIKERYDATVEVCENDVMFFYMVTNLKFFWNVWYHYKTHLNLDDYDYADIEQFIAWLDKEKKHFRDGAIMADWLSSISHDINSVETLTYDEIRQKMLELLEF